MGLIWPAKAVRLRSPRQLTISPACLDSSIKGKSMGQTGKKGELPKKDEKKSKKSQAKPVEDEDDEDGDIATPKRDRYGTDDEPL